LKIHDEDENTGLLLSTKLKRGPFVQAILKKLQSTDKTIMSDIDKQFYVNTSDYSGDTALHVAAKKDYQTIADVICREGAALGLDLEIKNKQGKTYHDLVQERN